ncbi:MAG: glutaminyl-peptide cyclotransferase [Corynebacterium sp.]|nr:glutaminyl-peptide cyclotransferase [Corynebacterium sp.]
MVFMKLAIVVPLVVVASLSSLVGGCGSSSAPAPVVPSPLPQAVERLRVEIVQRHPFDATSFTQGLEVDGDKLLVSTGWKGKSRIYHTTVNNEQSDSHDIDASHFGEGVTRVGDVVWELTWQAGVAYKRDAVTLAEIGSARYSGEGWGLCSFDDVVVMSDGTNELRLVDPDTFAERSRVRVTLSGEPAAELNELECVPGADGRRLVYSNVFLSTDIYRIDVDSGQVTGIIDASTVPNNAAPDSNNVLNGIAHIPGTDRFYITGKRWPDLYEVRFKNKAD